MPYRRTGVAEGEGGAEQMEWYSETGESEAQYKARTAAKNLDRSKMQAARKRAKGAFNPDQGFIDPSKKGADLRMEYRREVAYGGILENAKDWKGNRWFRQAFEEAYNADQSKIKAAHEAESWGYTGAAMGEGEGYAGQEKSFLGYGGFNKMAYNKWAHKLAARAGELHTEYESEQTRRQEEQRMTASKSARGGMGRGSILTTSRGATGAGEVGKRTLVGR